MNEQSSNRAIEQSSNRDKVAPLILGTMGDVPACVDLLVIYGDRERLPLGLVGWSRERMEPLVRADAEQGRLYVARDGTRVVATLALCEPLDDYVAAGHWAEPDRPSLLLHRLAVAPDRQGTGLGTACVRDAERKAAALGAHYLRIDALEHQPRVIEFYRRLGYTECGVAKVETGVPINPVAGLVLFEKLL
jgi:GNAT superfamily N-acetyltransferase